MNDPRYPTGQWQRRDSLTRDERVKAIEALDAAPSRMRDAVAGLTPAQLDTSYREGGWTVRQVVHHVPDSHMNGYIRVKFALTTPDPHLLGYDEDAWAKLGDVVATPIETSVALLEGIHRRWVALLRSLTPEQCARPFEHSEHGRMTVDSIISNYAWHGAHHIAQITSLRERMGW